MTATATAAQDQQISQPPGRRLPERRGLSREEEHELAARIATGDLGARDRMLSANVGLVHAIARHFLRRGLDLDDLVSEGQLGLIRATRDFDTHFGARFITYAAYWIKQAIRQALIVQAPMIRLPVYMVRLLTRWRRAAQALSRDLGRAPSIEEVAAALGLSEAQRRMVARAQEAGRLRTKGSFGEGIDDRMLAEVPGHDGRVGERMESEEARAEVLKRLDRLDARERAVVAGHYGLDGDRATLKVVGHRMGKTGEWARKLELRALHKLRDE